MLFPSPLARYISGAVCGLPRLGQSWQAWQESDDRTCIAFIRRHGQVLMFTHREACGAVAEAIPIEG